jgi:hypothetical protein
MENLLRLNFTSHYRLSTNPIINSANCTDASFDLKDDQILIYPTGFGDARFENSGSRIINVIHYEDFFKSLPSGFQHNKENCDLLVYSNNNYFISLNELTETETQYIGDFYRMNGVKVIGKRNKAISQLSNTLGYLIQVPEILTYFSFFRKKRCCFFSKKSNAPNGIHATSTFSRLAEIVPNGIQSAVPYIDNNGFEFWEFYGNQTCEI